MPTKNRTWYRKLLPTAHRTMLDRKLRPMLASMSGKNLIIGAGYDPYAAQMPNATSVWLTDIDPANEVIDEIVDAHDMGFSDASFDGAVAIEVFEHLRDPVKALAEVYRVLAPGGEVVVSVPFLFHVHGDPFDFQRFTEFGLKELFDRFEFVEITPFGGRIHAISDILTTAARPLAALRFVNHLLTLPIFSERASADCPSGYIIRARKHGG